MKSKNVLISILAGAAAGALAGILFAPEEGAKTRKKILKKGDDFYGSMKDKFDALFKTISRKMGKVKDEAAETAEKVKEEAADHFEKVKKEATAYASHVKVETHEKQGNTNYNQGHHNKN